MRISISKIHHYYSKHTGNIELVQSLSLLFIVLSSAYTVLILQKKSTQNLVETWTHKTNMYALSDYSKYTKSFNQKHKHSKLKINRNFQINDVLLITKKLPLALKAYIYGYSNINLKFNQYEPFQEQTILNTKSFEVTHTLPTTHPKKYQSSSLKKLKHGLWLQSMCHAQMSELFLPLLGADILADVALNVKLPNVFNSTIFKPKFLRCP